MNGDDENEKSMGIIKTKKHTVQCRQHRCAHENNSDKNNGPCYHRQSSCAHKLNETKPWALTIFRHSS